MRCSSVKRVDFLNDCVKGRTPRPVRPSDSEIWGEGGRRTATGDFSDSECTAVITVDGGQIRTLSCRDEKEIKTYPSLPSKGKDVEINSVPSGKDEHARHQVF